MESIKKKRSAPKKISVNLPAPAESETPAAQPDDRPFIVGIGASAGGLEALSQLLPNLPKNLGLSYVVVQHLSPTYRSMMAQLLGRETTMPVKDIEDGARPEPNTVYITPPNRNVTLSAGCFRLVVPAKESLPKPSVNLFFASLAEPPAALPSRRTRPPPNTTACRNRPSTPAVSIGFCRPKTWVPRLV